MKPLRLTYHELLLALSHALLELTNTEEPDDLEGHGYYGIRMTVLGDRAQMRIELELLAGSIASAMASVSSGSAAGAAGTVKEE